MTGSVHAVRSFARSRGLPAAVVGSLAALCLLSACGGGGGGSHGAAGSTSSASPVTALAPVTATPASEQLRWVVAELNASATPSRAELAAHFSPAFLAEVPPKALVASLADLAGQNLQIARVLRSPGSHGDLALEAELTSPGGAAFDASIAVSATAPHLIVGLDFRLAAPTINSWSGVDAALERLAPHASLYAGYAGGGEIHALNGTEAGAIGSAFKLYVLGALANAVEHGSVRWTTRLAIHERWKSLPGGDMRLDPAGATFSLLHYAQQMISVSDNTAADHLIHRLGRNAVETQLVALGNHSVSRDEPFLTTRELFALKLAAPASLTRAYANGGTAARTRLLARVDAFTPTLAEAAAWTAPRYISTLEWFASAADLAHAINRLEVESRRRGLAPLRQILAINPGIALNAQTWSYVGYKGGSEPGVISTTWYLRRRDGRAFVLSIILNDPAGNISTVSEVSVAEAAVNLLARS